MQEKEELPKKEMSHQFKKTKKGGGRGGRGKKKRQTVGLMDLPDNVMLRVLTFLDEDSLEAMSAVSQRSHNLVNQVKAAEGEKGLQLVQLPTEVLTLIASHLGVKDLGRLAQVNKRFKVQDFSFSTSFNCCSIGCLPCVDILRYFNTTSAFKLFPVRWLCTVFGHYIGHWSISPSSNFEQGLG